jgi:hypothetical protein
MNSPVISGVELLRPFSPLQIPEPYTYLDFLHNLSRYSDGLWTPGRGSIPGKGTLFLFPLGSKPALGPTHTPIRWVPEAPFAGIKLPEREADHSPTSSAEIKNGGVITPLPDFSMTWCLIN